MQAFVDESGSFNTKSNGPRISLVVAVALPEPARIAEMAARMVGALHSEAPRSWKDEKGEIKAKLVPRSDLRRILAPMQAESAAPILTSLAIIDHTVATESTVQRFKAERLINLDAEIRRLEQAGVSTRFATAEKAFLQDASPPILLKLYAALPHVVRGLVYLMHCYYPPEFHSSLDNLELVVDRESFLNPKDEAKKEARRWVIRGLVQRSLEQFGKRWGGWLELKQWRERRILHPMERLAQSQGARGWSLQLLTRFHASAEEHPLLFLADLLAFVYRSELEAHLEGRLDAPIMRLRGRCFPSVVALGDREDVVDPTLKSFTPIFEQWGHYNLVDE